MKRFCHILLIAILCVALGSSYAEAQTAIKRPHNKVKTAPKTKTSTSRPAGGARTSKPSRSVQAHSNTPAAQKGPLSRKTIYTFQPSERIYESEYVNNHKSNGNQWIMLTYDESAKKMSIVINGVRHTTADYINIHRVSPTDYNSLNYVKQNADGVTLHIGNRDYGPYESINDYALHPSDKSKVRIIYTRMGMKMMLDFDGSSLRLPDNFSYASDGIPYRSPANGRYCVKFKDNAHVIVTDGGDVRIYPSDVANVGVNYVMVYDNGDSEFCTYSNDKNGYERKRFYISHKTIYPLANDEEYDFFTRSKVKISNDGTSRAIHPYIFETRADEIEWKQRDNEWVAALQYALSDPSGRNQFLGSWEYDYVMINDRKIPSRAPIDAYYDPSENAFVWTTIDGRNLVQNTYRL